MGYHAEHYEDQQFAYTAGDPNVDTSGLTVKMYYVDWEGNYELVGSAAGTEAGTDVTISADASALTPDKVYGVYAAAAADDTNPIVLIDPDENTVYVKKRPVPVAS